MIKPQFKNPQQAFAEAIEQGRLSSDKTKANFAGHYMYMGPACNSNKDAFKNIITREYDV